MIIEVLPEHAPAIGVEIGMPTVRDSRDISSCLMNWRWMVVMDIPIIIEDDGYFHRNSSLTSTTNSERENMTAEVPGAELLDLLAELEEKIYGNEHQVVNTASDVNVGNFLMQTFVS